MKRIKIILNTLAITIAIAGALATRYYMQEHIQPQYIPVDNSYRAVGTFGVDYNCYDTNMVCTFYLTDSGSSPKKYLPYRKGQYVPSKK